MCNKIYTLEGNVKMAGTTRGENAGECGGVTPPLPTEKTAQFAGQLNVVAG